MLYHDTWPTGRMLAMWVAAAVLACHPGRAWCASLLTNGGFESGRTGWTGGTVTSELPCAGAACLRVDDDRTDLSVTAMTGLIPVTRSSDGMYQLDGWVRAAASGQVMQLSVNQYDAGGNWISGLNHDFPVTAGPAWSPVRYVINALSTNCASVRVFLRPVAWTTSGSLKGSGWFDSLSFGPRPLSGAWLVPSGALRVWRAPPEEKVRRSAILQADAPRETEVSVSAARGESEAFQLVLLPDQTNSLRQVTFSALRHVETTQSPAVTFSIREVAYVNVTAPTDSESLQGMIPDPLPALVGPLVLAAGRQQPLWVTLNVPGETSPGDYTGQIQIELASGSPLVIPLRLHVWDFALPREPAMRTAYGMDLDTLDAYHNLHGDPELRLQVLRLYLQDCAAHRVSPIDPIGDDGVDISYHDAPWGRGSQTPDPDAPAGTNLVFEVVDSSATADLAAYAADLAPISPARNYTLSWNARTDGAHAYLVSVNQYDANGNWIAGRNLDFPQTGSGQWQHVEVTLASRYFASTAAALRIHLYARGWSASGALLGRTWFDDIRLAPVEGGSTLLAGGDFQYAAVDGIVVRADFTRFDAAARFAFDELGLNAFRLPLPGFAGGSGQEHSVGKILWFDWGTPEYERMFSNTLHAVTDHLAERGWLDKAYAYWFDEPGTNDYAFVNSGMDLIHRVEPRLRRLLTEHGAPELRGHVDIWTPLLNAYEDEWASACRRAGDDIWWYVATGPRSPWPNNFIDHPGLEPRVQFWMAWHTGVKGSLYWNTTWWRHPDRPQDPWADPMSYSVDSPVNWGNGDGRLVYPPRRWTSGETLVEGPTPSIRWELIREGLEDYDYLALLKQQADQLAQLDADPALGEAAQQLLASPGNVYSSFTEFAADPAVLRARRDAVATEIERLTSLIDDLGGRRRPQPPTGISIAVR
ncbi:MAG: DUF4091 domain-containing protein [Lentisphaerae bacterium]|nr:DUF4091 domain-containing protein [Lentisphaerota bacterium]